jgi:hypothetical protein
MVEDDQQGQEDDGGAGELEEDISPEEVALARTLHLDSHDPGPGQPSGADVMPDETDDPPQAAAQADETGASPGQDYEPMEEPGSEVIRNSRQQADEPIGATATTEGESDSAPSPAPIGAAGGERAGTAASPRRRRETNGTRGMKATPTRDRPTGLDRALRRKWTEYLLRNQVNAINKLEGRFLLVATTGTWAPGHEKLLSILRENSGKLADNTGWVDGLTTNEDGLRASNTLRSALAGTVVALVDTKSSTAVSRSTVFPEFSTLARNFITGDATVPKTPIRTAFSTSDASTVIAGCPTLMCEAFRRLRACAGGGEDDTCAGVIRISQWTAAVKLASLGINLFACLSVPPPGTVDRLRVQTQSTRSQTRTLAKTATGHGIWMSPPIMRTAINNRKNTVGSVESPLRVAQHPAFGLTVYASKSVDAALPLLLAREVDLDPDEDKQTHFYVVGERKFDGRPLTGQSATRYGYGTGATIAMMLCEPTMGRADYNLRQEMAMPVERNQRLHRNQLVTLDYGKTPRQRWKDGNYTTETSMVSEVEWWMVDTSEATTPQLPAPTQREQSRKLMNSIKKAKVVAAEPPKLESIKLPGHVPAPLASYLYRFAKRFHLVECKVQWHVCLASQLDKVHADRPADTGDAAGVTVVISDDGSMNLHPWARLWNIGLVHVTWESRDVGWTPLIGIGGPSSDMGNDRPSDEQQAVTAAAFLEQGIMHKAYTRPAELPNRQALSGAMQLRAQGLRAEWAHMPHLQRQMTTWPAWLELGYGHMLAWGIGMVVQEIPEGKLRLFCALRNDFARLLPQVTEPTTTLALAKEVLQVVPNLHPTHLGGLTERRSAAENMVTRDIDSDGDMADVAQAALAARYRINLIVIDVRPRTGTIVNVVTGSLRTDAPRLHLLLRSTPTQGSMVPQGHETLVDLLVPSHAWPTTSYEGQIEALVRQELGRHGAWWAVVRRLMAFYDTDGARSDGPDEAQGAAGIVTGISHPFVQGGEEECKLLHDELGPWAIEASRLLQGDLSLSGEIHHVGRERLRDSWASADQVKLHKSRIEMPSGPIETSELRTYLVDKARAWTCTLEKDGEVEWDNWGVDVAVDTWHTKPGSVHTLPRTSGGWIAVVMQVDVEGVTLPMAEGTLHGEWSTCQTHPAETRLQRPGTTLAARSTGLARGAGRNQFKLGSTGSMTILLIHGINGGRALPEEAHMDDESGNFEDELPSADVGPALTSVRWPGGWVGLAVWAPNGQLGPVEHHTIPDRPDSVSTVSLGAPPAPGRAIDIDLSDLGAAWNGKEPCLRLVLGIMTRMLAQGEPLPTSARGIETLWNRAIRPRLDDEEAKPFHYTVRGLMTGGSYRLGALPVRMSYNMAREMATAKMGQYQDGGEGDEAQLKPPDIATTKSQDGPSFDMSGVLTINDGTPLSFRLPREAESDAEGTHTDLLEVLWRNTTRHRLEHTSILEAALSVPRSVRHTLLECRLELRARTPKRMMLEHTQDHPCVVWAQSTNDTSQALRLAVAGIMGLAIPGQTSVPPTWREPLERLAAGHWVGAPGRLGQLSELETDMGGLKFLRRRATGLDPPATAEWAEAALIAVRAPDGAHIKIDEAAWSTWHKGGVRLEAAVDDTAAMKAVLHTHAGLTRLGALTRCEVAVNRKKMSSRSESFKTPLLIWRRWGEEILRDTCGCSLSNLSSAGTPRSCWDCSDYFRCNDAHGAADSTAEPTCARCGLSQVEKYLYCDACETPTLGNVVSCHKCGRVRHCARGCAVGWKETTAGDDAGSLTHTCPRRQCTQTPTLRLLRELREDRCPDCGPRADKRASLQCSSCRTNWCSTHADSQAHGQGFALITHCKQCKNPTRSARKATTEASGARA